MATIKELMQSAIAEIDARGGFANRLDMRLTLDRIFTRKIEAAVDAAVRNERALFARRLREEAATLRGAVFFHAGGGVISELGKETRAGASRLDSLAHRLEQSIKGVFIYEEAHAEGAENDVAPDENKSEGPSEESPSEPDPVDGPERPGGSTIQSG